MPEPNGSAGDIFDGTIFLRSQAPYGLLDRERGFNASSGRIVPGQIRCSNHTPGCSRPLDSIHPHPAEYEQRPTSGRHDDLRSMLHIPTGPEPWRSRMAPMQFHP